MSAQWTGPSAADELTAQQIAAAAAEAGWVGTAVVGADLLGMEVAAIVEFLPAAWRRAAETVGPVLDRPTLNLWENLDDSGDPGRPVRMLAFASDRPWRRAVDDLRQLNGIAPGMITRRALPTRSAQLDADFHGLSVVVLDDESARLVVAGRTRCLSTAARTVTVRLFEEVLFGLALRQDLLVSHDAPVDATISGRRPS